MYISYLRGYYHSWILLSSKAWPLRGHVGFTADFVHVAVFKRHQVRDQACSGAIREGFKKSVDQVQTVMYPKTGCSQGESSPFSYAHVPSSFYMLNLKKKKKKKKFCPHVLYAASEIIQRRQNLGGITYSDTPAFIFSFFAKIQFPCYTFTSVWQII